MKKHILKISITIGIMLLGLLVNIFFSVKPKVEAPKGNEIIEVATIDETTVPEIPVQLSEPQYHIEDDAVRKAVEHFEKSESEFTEDGESNTSDIDSTKVMEAYMDFLYGRRTAFDWADTEHTEIKDTGHYVNDYDMYYDSYNTKGKRFDGGQFAFFDMNGDKIPELHVHTGIGAEYTIFTYYHGEVVQWHSTSGYYRPQNDGSILYIRLGGGPTHVSYQFETFDFWGNVTFHVNFEKYDWSEEGELNGGHDGIYDERDTFSYDGVEIPKRDWDYMTEKYLSVGDDLIVWEKFGEDDQ